MSSANRKYWTSRVGTAGWPFQVRIVMLLLIMLAPVLPDHGRTHPTDESGRTTIVSVIGTGEADAGLGIPSVPAGLSCHLAGACLVAVMPPEAVRLRGIDAAPARHPVGTSTWTARPVAPDIKPPIA